jgi:hypothetical protein
MNTTIPTPRTRAAIDSATGIEDAFQKAVECSETLERELIRARRCHARIELALADALSTFRHDGGESIITAERQEARAEALKQEDVK